MLFWTQMVAKQFFLWGEHHHLIPLAPILFEKYVLFSHPLQDSLLLILLFAIYAALRTILESSGRNAMHLINADFSYICSNIRLFSLGLTHAYLIDTRIPPCQFQRGYPNLTFPLLYQSTNLGRILDPPLTRHSLMETPDTWILSSHHLSVHGDPIPATVQRPVDLFHQLNQYT